MKPPPKEVLKNIQKKSMFVKEKALTVKQFTG
jgi:hypothetical protein